MRYIIMLMIMVSCIGCENIMNKPYKNYRVNGEVIQCRMEARANCGVSLWECNNGIVYSCLTNLQWLP